MSVPSSMMDEVDAEMEKLLQEQEQFLRGNIKASAKVMRKGTPHKNKQQHQQQHQQQQPAAAAPSEPSFTGPSLVQDVKEKFPENGAPVAAFPTATKGGFPSVKLGNIAAGQKKKSSLFSRRRRLEKTNESNKGAEIGPSEQDFQIQNMKKLQSMHGSEIRAMQNEIADTLPADLIDMLRKRGSAKARPAPRATALDENLSLDEERKAEEIIAKQDDENKNKNPSSSSVSPILESTEPRSSEVSEGFYEAQWDQLQTDIQSLDADEQEKTEWTRPVPDTQCTTSTLLSNAAAERVDFDGVVIPKEDRERIPAHSGLYHHGTDPNAPGYTIEELMMLARSKNARQRVIALGVLRKVLSRRREAMSVGQKELVFPTELPEKFPVVLRFGIDSQNVNVLTTAISALHEYLVPSFDDEDRIFDTIYGHQLPPPATKIHATVQSTAVSQDSYHQIQVDRVWYYAMESHSSGGEKHDVPTYTAEQVADLDPVQGLLAMDILPRLRYILTEMNPLNGYIFTNDVLDILTAIGRHSPFGAQKVMSMEGIWKYLRDDIIDNKDTDTREGMHVSLIKTVRLIRVLVQADRQLVLRFAEWGMLDSLKAFLMLGGDYFGSKQALEGIQVEVLRVWRVCLQYELDVESFSYVHSVLCSVKWTAPVRRGIFNAMEVLLTLRPLSHSLEAEQIYEDRLYVYANEAVEILLSCCGCSSTVNKETPLWSLLGSALHLVATYLQSSERATASDIRRAKGRVLLERLTDDYSGHTALLTMVQSCQSNITTTTTTRDDCCYGIAINTAHGLIRVLTALAIRGRMVLDSTHAETLLCMVHTQLRSGPLCTITYHIQHLSNVLSVAVLQYIQLVSSARHEQPQSLIAKLRVDVANAAQQLIPCILPGEEVLVQKLIDVAQFTVENSAKRCPSGQLKNLLLSIVCQCASVLKHSNALLRRELQTWNETTDNNKNNNNNNNNNVVWAPARVHFVVQSCHLILPMFLDENVTSEENSAVSQSYRDSNDKQLTSATFSNLPLPTHWMYLCFSSVDITSPSLFEQVCWWIRRYDTLVVANSTRSKAVVVKKAQCLLHVFLRSGHELMLETDSSSVFETVWRDTMVSGFELYESERECFISDVLRGIVNDTPGMSSKGTCDRDDTSTTVGIQQHRNSAAMLEFVETLMENFQSLSFGNTVFGQCMLLFISTMSVSVSVSVSVGQQQAQDIRAFVFKELRINPKLISFMNEFLPSWGFVKRCVYPIETNRTILHEFVQLVTDRQCVSQMLLRTGYEDVSFLYAVVLHHLSGFLFRRMRDFTDKNKAYGKQQMLKQLCLSCPQIVLKHLLSYEEDERVWQTCVVQGKVPAVLFNGKTTLVPDRVSCLEFLIRDEVEGHTKKQLEAVLHGLSSFPPRP